MLLSDSARDEVFPHDTAKWASSVPYDAVVVGLASGRFDYAHMNTAFRILKGEEDRSGHNVPLIATHKAKYIERDDPPGLSLGPGPFVTALEDATGCKAHVVGKPTKTFFELVINDFSLSELSDDGRIAVIGDDVEADLGEGAVELGLWRVLGELPGVVDPHVGISTHRRIVKTGKYRPGDEARAGVVPPDEVHDNFSSFVDHLLSTNTQEKGKLLPVSALRTFW
jgi:hypothetical protein